jgi:hypothetical protein
MLEYDAGHFSGLAATRLGSELWPFLSSEPAIRAMETASDLGHPALAGVEEDLIRRFEAAVLEDRTKQMIGHMVKQIMKHCGYVVDQNDVKMNSVPFSKATRYRRPEWLPVHVYRNSGDPRDLCFGPRRSAERFPRLNNQNKWVYWSTFSTDLRGSVAFGVRLSELRKQFEASGFHRRHLERSLTRAP